MSSFFRESHQGSSTGPDINVLALEAVLAWKMQASLLRRELQTLEVHPIKDKENRK